MDVQKYLITFVLNLHIRTYSMQIKPEDLNREKNILSIDNMSKDEVFFKITGREEFNLLPHLHNRHQIIYILSGTLHIEVDEINYFATEGQLVWIPPCVSHHLSSNNKQVALLVTYFYIEEIVNDKFSIYITDELIVRNLYFISSYGRINNNEKSNLFSFANSFFKLLPQIAKKTSFPSQRYIALQDNRLFPVLEYIKNYLYQDLTIRNVALYFGFSVRSLTRLFTNSGLSFVSYLNYQRVIRAIELLTEDSKNIKEIAYSVGFNSPGTFSRIFRQITGTSPSKYIKNRERWPLKK